MSTPEIGIRLIILGFIGLMSLFIYSLRKIERLKEQNDRKIILIQAYKWRSDMATKLALCAKDALVEIVKNRNDNEKLQKLIDDIADDVKE